VLRDRHAAPVAAQGTLKSNSAVLIESLRMAETVCAAIREAPCRHMVDLGSDPGYPFSSGPLPIPPNPMIRMIKIGLRPPGRGRRRGRADEYFREIVSFGRIQAMFYPYVSHLLCVV